ncbi:AraC family transcriptional regulator [Paenibacillus soyae]|uniref:AraC family transcriptional regulator n=1 Tax=Paenibacillus soyae TaxID=2969249 RepID=A0A9X2S799_9BACL|nr:AraC family transcriptional regulator [Paenibacillus soyae]MCR2802821.1 AraC family transcriptional regulator [Paenibacillus soyae]
MLSIVNLQRIQGMSWYEESDALSNVSRFVIVSYGKCLYWINGEKVLAEKGDFLFIPEGSAFYGKSVPTVFHEQYVMDLRVDPLADAGELRLPMFGRPGYSKSKAGCYELVLERLRALWNEWQEKLPFSSLRVLSAVLDALVLWGRELERGGPADVSVQHAERMKAYIQEHYRTKITKEQLGDFIGRSPNHAASLFRRITGQTISEFAHNVRMRTAVYMLKESLLTVAEIADYLGYSDTSYFQRVFKRTTGVSPSYYLKERSFTV